MLLFSCKGRTQDKQTFNDNYEDCVYDPNSITESLLRDNSLIYSYLWNDKEKKGSAILKNGFVLKINKWACTHYGASVEMLTDISFEEFNKNWRHYILILFKISGDVTPYNAVDEYLKEAKNPMFTENGTFSINITSDGLYPMINVELTETEDGYLFYGTYYKN